MDLDDKVAIVTGGGAGIGAALVRALAEAGAYVVAMDIERAAAERVVARLEGRAMAVGADVADEAALRDTIARAEGAFGPVDLFCANAGIMPPWGLDAPDEVWSDALAVNVLAHVRAARLLVPAWVERGSGYFVSTASAAGLLTQIGAPAYSVTKHAAVAFAEWLSVTYGDRGVRVSCICPMGVNTAMLNDGFASSRAAYRSAVKAVRTAGPLAEPDDVARATLTAISEERFLVLPHPEVLDYFRRKGADYDRWIAGMRRLRERAAS